MNKKVLVVDDTPDLLASMVEILKMESFEVMEASNGRNALLQLESFHPDLLITDLMMPELNGYELIKEIRKSPELKKIVILVVSALSSQEDESKALKAGADSYLKKPCTLDQLVEITKKLTR